MSNGSKHSGKRSPDNNIDISDLLMEADSENERDIAKGDERQRTKELEKTLIAESFSSGPKEDEENQEKKDDAETKRRFDAETIELIDKYSTKEIKDKKSDTQELREALARKLEDEKLRGYLTADIDTQAKKADDLRTKILGPGFPEESPDRDDGELRASGGEKRENILRDVSARFTEEEVEQQEFEQAEMFPLGDTMTIRNRENEYQYADYDRDYQDLGSRVVAGGIPESERDDGQVSFLSDETDVAPIGGEADPTDTNLGLAFDMMEDGSYRLDPAREKQILQSRKKKRRKKELYFEYTSKTQNPEMNGKLRAAKRHSVIRLLLTIFLTAVLCLMEFGPLFGFLLKTGDVNTGARIYILADLQLVFLCALVILPSIVKGLRGIASFRMNAESVLVFGLFFDLLYTAISVIRGPEIDRLGLYGAVLCYGCVCSAASTLLSDIRNERVFRVISTERLKYVAERLKPTAKESDEFGRYLDETSEMYTVKKAGFIDGFVGRTVKRPRSDDMFHVILPLILFGGFAIFAALLVMKRPLSEALRAFYAMIVTAVPSVSFFIISLPMFIANGRAKKYSAAFVGNAIAEEYEYARVLSFADTEVFPSNLVSIAGIKTYNDYRIDKIIPELAKCFSFLGGPLKKVTERMVDGPVERYESARVIENTHDGICVAMDGRLVFLGKRSFLLRYHFEAPTDPGDDAFEKKSGSVMFVGIDKHLAAKVQVRYGINPRFETLLRELYRAGLCLGVKTMDPNITNDLITRSVKFKKCPVSVLKQTNPKDISGESPSASSGIVCNSSLHNFLRMFAMSDKLRHVGRCNQIVALVSVVLSFLTIAFLAITGDLQAFGVLQAVIFQVCWQIPVWALSFAMIR